MLFLRIWKRERATPVPAYSLRKEQGDDAPDEEFFRFIDLKFRVVELIERCGPESDVVLACSPPPGTADMTWHRSHEGNGPVRSVPLDESERATLWHELCNIAAKEAAYAS